MPDFGRWTNNGGDPSLNEVHRTDRFLDALADEQPVYSSDHGEAELAFLLAGWRDEVRQAPATNVVTTRDAAIALDRAASSRQRRRLSMAVVGSTAAAVLALGGFGAVVFGAGPGDPLYGLRTMLFGEQQVTRDDQVVLAAQTELAEVQQLIDQGDWVAAQDKLQTITTTVAVVGDVERQQELVDQWQQLSVKVETRDVNATVPPDAPPVTLPDVPSDFPLPGILDPGTTTSETSETSETTTTSPTDTTSPTETTTTSPTDTTSPSETTSPTSSPSEEPTTTSPEEPATTTSGVPAEPPPPTSTEPEAEPEPTTIEPATTEPTTTTTTVAPTTTTTTTTTTTVASATREPSAGEGGTGVTELPPSTRTESERTQQTVTIPVTTTTPLFQLPDAGSDGE